MIPTWIKTEQIATKVVKQPSKTYHLDLQRGRIVGFVDGYEAIKQAIIKIMLTEKYAYVIYDHYYGVGLEQYIGKDISFVVADLGSTIENALLYDNRILAVNDIEITRGSNIDGLRVKYSVETVDGVLSGEQEVKMIG
ncbi:DUF2634 domain-containing protein [Phascolarctobacterium faecium]|uniref:DUF2634 domain-containing protein n=1 Tax=Phascolarctobacterium faecium TaxID=33025 RepID=A0A7X3BWW7_9FIRM|nr:DUF2634 domain-containing protein [Phascolarctobacterium faecium]KAA3379885.1 DUF2634 domain-containing protein [Akkermansia muciniphila]MTS25558.1 DUF2634 domain-containing protein [Sellimonas intestinalis]MTS82150.1 DUF2634 domain-containing protein [Phascolarctobacterium faecium]MTT03396.1 DUF2634 domain-containing protein [Phascolarctobacterium faecium]MTT17459.1 DUF2634 domain-containing protein [Phascolarctobacterium faecium]